MFGTNPTPPQRNPLSLLLFATLAACGGGGGGGSNSSNPAPTLVGATFVGLTPTPAIGDTLLLTFSEDVDATGNLLDDNDVVLSGGTSLGAVAAAPTRVGARTFALAIGANANFLPGVTTINLSSEFDAIADTAGKLAAPATAVVIGDDDGQAPVLANVTIAGVVDELNGTGTAGGTLQVPVNGWTIDLTYSDNAGIDTARTQIVANVAVTTSSGSQPAGTNLRPFLTVEQAGNTAASYRVPTSTSFPPGAFTLTCSVVDVAGAQSAASSFAATVRPFSDALRPFERNVNPQQLWFLDFTRDIESLVASPALGGASVTSTVGANGRSDFLDVLHVLGLQHTAPLANVTPGKDSNQVVVEQFQLELLVQLAALHDGAPIAFTLTEPTPAAAFGGGSVGYANAGYSQISIAGTPSSAGVLGVAIFDPSNATQNDNTRTDFNGLRLGVFLQTIADVGLGPPGNSAFRQTFDVFAPIAGGTAIGANAQDGQRLTGTLNDGRTTSIRAAIDDLARFTAVIVAHECGHSVGLVRNGAMPQGLYGNDTINFPGSSDGHINVQPLFPAGATNVMSPALSYSGAIDPNTGFNSLNLAYLREQVFYGN